jgi:N-terminal half of MaoC dehydratase
MTSLDSHISADMRAAVGRAVDWRVSYPVSESDIRRWAVAVYYPRQPPREFWDAEYARERFGGILAPEEFNPFAWMAADQMVPAIAPELRDTDKPEKAVGIAGPGLRNQVNGGSEVAYGARMRPGDVIRSESRIKEYRERSGRLGLMLITLTEVVWTNQRGEHVRTSIDTSIRY